MRATIIAVTLLALPISALADDEHQHGNLSGGSAELHQLMEKSSKEMPQMKMSGDMVKDFAKSMVEHHRSGIKMAQAELEHGNDPELKSLAKEMIESQKKDISVLEKHR